MLNLIGTYECKADAKGRVKVSTALKKQLESVLHEGFVLKRSVFQPCLELYPMSEWESVMSDVNRLNRFVKKNNDFIRRFTAGVKIVELDSLDRFLISSDLQKIAGINKEVVLTAAMGYVEVWDKEQYENVINETAIDFGDLAEDVMGGLNREEDGVS